MGVNVVQALEQIRADQAQKLAPLTPDQVILELALAKIKKYTKPVKTKHLAKKLGVSRPELVRAMNTLKKRGLVYWHVPDKWDDNLYYGWAKVTCCNKCGFFNPTLFLNL